MIQTFRSKKNKQFYFRVVGRNHKIIAQSEGYKTTSGRRRGIEALRDIVRDAPPEDIGVR